MNLAMAADGSTEDLEEELKKASAFWAGFDLDGRRAELDARALDVSAAGDPS